MTGGGSAAWKQELSVLCVFQIWTRWRVNEWHWAHGNATTTKAAWTQSDQLRPRIAWLRLLICVCAAAPFAHRYINITASGGDGVQTAAPLQTAHKHLRDMCVFMRNRTMRLRWREKLAHGDAYVFFCSLMVRKEREETTFPLYFPPGRTFTHSHLL